MTKRAVIYARQSLDGQDKIEDQLIKCRAQAVARGWDVVAELVDNAVSASKNRDVAEWATLVAGFQRGDWDVVIASKLDRVARRVRDVLDLSDMGIGIVTTEADIDTTTDVGRFQATLLAALAELEVQRKGTRHREAHQFRANKGIPRVTKRPYGWQADGIHLEPREANHLRTAITNIVAGHSIAGEARRMNEAGERTPSYKTGSGGMVFTAKRLASILDRPRIAGINTYLGDVTELSVIEPVVDRETWEEYRALRQDPARKIGRPGKTPLLHWMSGVATCPCGETLRASTAQGRGKRYRYYRCLNAGRAGHVGISAETLEGTVTWQVYAQLVARHGDTPDTGTIRTLRLKRQEVADRIEAATEALTAARTDASRKAARKVLSRLDDEYEAVDADLTQALADQTAEDWVDVAETYFLPGLSTALDAQSLFLERWNETPVARKREITSRLFDVSVLPVGALVTKGHLDNGQGVFEQVPAYGSDRIRLHVKGR